MKNNVIPFRQMNWLKTVGAADQKCEKMLKAFAKKNKKILVIGAVGSGKNTVTNALVSYMHEINCEPILFPTITVRNIEDLAGHQDLKNFKGFLKLKYGAILPVGYEKGYYLKPYLPCLPSIAQGFDIVLDVRKLPDGQRQVAQIFEMRASKLKCVYRSKEFTKLQAGLAA